MEIQEQVRNLEKQIVNCFNELSRKIDGIAITSQQHEKRVDDHEDRIDRAEQSLADGRASFKEVYAGLGNVADTLKEVKRFMEKVDERMAKNDTDVIRTKVEFLERFFWIVLTTAVGGLGTGLIALFGLFK